MLDLIKCALDEHQQGMLCESENYLYGALLDIGHRTSQQRALAEL